MSREYTILRDMSRAFTTDPFGGTPLAMGAAESLGAAAVPMINTATLDKAELSDVVRAPEVRAIAPVIPTRLVFPVSADDSGTSDERTPPHGPTWGVRAVGADASSWTGAGVTVAVLDTGIDAGHPAFTGVTLLREDFSGSGDDDVVGHGTHCAGTIFGRDVNGTRIGVAPGVDKALIGKVLADNGSGDSRMIFEGIQWALRHGAEIISMSLGFDFPGYVSMLMKSGWPADLATSMALEGYRANLRMFDALMGVVKQTASFGRGTVVVAAAGNESRRDLRPDYELAASIPAAADGVVSVGALEQTDGGLDIAYFSNTFPLVAAPGVDVWSAEAGTGKLVPLNGTSMATPHVAGVLALWWEHMVAEGMPSPATNVYARLLANADVGALVSDVDSANRGAGIVKAP